jgi:hypothetical protein
MRAALDDPRDEPCLLEDMQVPRQGRLRDGDAAGRLADGGRPMGETLDYLPAYRVRECLERIVSHSANNLLQ